MSTSAENEIDSLSVRAVVYAPKDVAYKIREIIESEQKEGKPYATE